MSDKFPEMDIEFEKLRKRWYQEENVIFNIQSNLKYKETCFYRPPSINKNSVMNRPLKCNAVTYIYQNMERYHFFEEPMNIYHSLAHLPNLPMMAFSIPKKEKQMEEFNSKFYSYVTGWDFLIDVDNKDLTLSYSTSTKIKDILDKFGVPYTLRFSGKKGFHFVIEYQDIPTELRELGFNNMVEKIKQFAINMKEKEKLFDWDLSVIELRRICKTPYSVVYPHYLVALPLSDNQFENFKIRDMSLPILLEQVDKLYLRGNLKRKGSPDGFYKLIVKYLNI